MIATQQGGTNADTSAVTVSVLPPTLTQLVLAPASITLAPGGTSQFAVSGTWSDGSTTVPAVTYSATGGTIAAGGLYTAATAPGTFRVIATQQGGTKADTSAVTVSVLPPTLTQLVLAPASITLAPGGTGQFAVSGTWSDGSTTVPAVTYSATGGTITAGGVYTAGATPGAYRVIATQQGGTNADTSAVTVSVLPPTLTQLVLTPASITLAPGGTSQFAVSGTWSDGSTTVPAVTYSATGGTITAGGVYTAGASPGAYRVIATQQGGTNADTSAVTVSVSPPTLTQLVLTPAVITLAPGGTSQFAVSGTWSDGSTTVPAVTYSATGGTIAAGGLYTAATAPGTFRVIATQQGGTKADTSAVTVSVLPPTLTQLVLAPASITLAPGGTSQFAVSGTWSDGSTTVPAVTYSATGGTIAAGGLYTAATAPGTFRVIATHQGGSRADTSSVTVTTLPPSRLELVTQPAGAVSGQAFSQQPVVELRDAQNQAVTGAGVVVTASKATGSGSLSGTLAATTDAQGRATFATLAITGSGLHTLDFTALSLTKATSQAFVVAAGAPLVVNAGTDQTISRSTPAALSATVSSTRGPVKMFWRKISGPGVAAFAHEQFNSSFENGTTSEWDGDGGGQSIGGASVSQNVAHSGSHSWMGYNDSTLAVPFNYSAKLLRWRFNNSEAYYSAWFYWPSSYGVTDIGDNYVNIFQWKEGGAPFDPPWIVIAKNFSGVDEFGIHDYFGADITRTGIAIPKNTWFNITAYMKASTTVGELVVWIDGQLAYNRSGLNTLGTASTLMWGVGNYGTPGIGPGKQLYVDDAVVVQAWQDITHTNATFSAAGVYVLRLTAFDGTTTLSDDVTITVQ